MCPEPAFPPPASLPCSPHSLAGNSNSNDHNTTVAHSKVDKRQRRSVGRTTLLAIVWAMTRHTNDQDDEVIDERRTVDEDVLYLVAAFLGGKHSSISRSTTGGIVAVDVTLYSTVQLPSPQHQQPKLQPQEEKRNVTGHTIGIIGDDRSATFRVRRQQQQRRGGSSGFPSCSNHHNGNDAMMTIVVSCASIPCVELALAHNCSDNALLLSPSLSHHRQRLTRDRLGSGGDHLLLPAAMRRRRLSQSTTQSVTSSSSSSAPLFPNPYHSNVGAVASPDEEIRASPSVPAGARRHPTAGTIVPLSHIARSQQLNGHHHHHQQPGKEDDHTLDLVAMLISRAAQQPPLPTSSSGSLESFVHQALFRTVQEVPATIPLSSPTTANTASSRRPQQQQPAAAAPSSPSLPTQSSPIGPVIPQLLRALIMSRELSDAQKRRRIAVVVRLLLNHYVASNVRQECPAQHTTNDSANSTTTQCSCCRPLQLQATNPLRQAIQQTQQLLGVCTCWLGVLLQCIESNASPTQIVVEVERGDDDDSDNVADDDSAYQQHHRSADGAFSTSIHSTTTFPSSASSSSSASSLLEAAISAQCSVFLDVLTEEVTALRRRIEGSLESHRVHVQLQHQKDGQKHRTQRRGGGAATSTIAKDPTTGTNKDDLHDLARQAIAVIVLETAVAAMFFEVGPSGNRPVYSVVSATTMVTCSSGGGGCDSNNNNEMAFRGESGRRNNHHDDSEPNLDGISPITTSFGGVLLRCGQPHVFVGGGSSNHSASTTTTQQQEQQRSAGGLAQSSVDPHPASDQRGMEYAQYHTDLLTAEYFLSTTPLSPPAAKKESTVGRCASLMSRQDQLRREFLRCVFLGVEPQQPFHVAFPAPYLYDELPLSSSRRPSSSPQHTRGGGGIANMFQRQQQREGAGFEFVAIPRAVHHHLHGGPAADPAVAANIVPSATSPIHFAALRGNVSFSRLFVQTARHWCAAARGDSSNNSRNHELQRVLNLQNNFGATPLWLAASKGHADVCRVLLDHGARANTSTRSEMSAVHVALISGHRAVVAVLLSYGADVTSRLMLEAQRLDAAATAGRSAPGGSLDDVLLPPVSFALLPRSSSSSSSHHPTTNTNLSNPAWASLLAEAHALHSISGGDGEDDDDDGDTDGDVMNETSPHHQFGAVEDHDDLLLQVGHHGPHNTLRRRTISASATAAQQRRGGSQEWVTVFGAWGMTAYVGMLLIALVARILLS